MCTQYSWTGFQQFVFTVCTLYFVHCALKTSNNCVITHCKCQLSPVFGLPSWPIASLPGISGPMLPILFSFPMYHAIFPIYHLQQKEINVRYILLSNAYLSKTVNMVNTWPVATFLFFTVLWYISHVVFVCFLLILPIKHAVTPHPVCCNSPSGVL